MGDWDLRVVEMDKRRVAQVVATVAGGGGRTAPAGEDASGAGDGASGSGRAERSGGVTAR